MIIRRSWRLWVFMVVIIVSTGCGNPEKALVGKWRMDTSGEIWAFQADGTMSLSGTLFPATGVYDFTEEGQLVIALDGLAELAGPQFYDVDIDGKQLTLGWHMPFDVVGNLYFTKVK